MAKYNPKLKYQWSNDATFEITGRDLGMFLNVVRSVLGTEEAAKIMLAERCNAAIEAIMVEYVEKDVIKEVVAEEETKMRVVKK